MTLGDLISKGGEGAVYNIKNKNSSCAKIYFSNFRTKLREEKIKHMIANPPKEIGGRFFKICWPEEILYENGCFVGFTMPKAYEYSTLPYHLCQPNIPKNLDTKWQNVYSRNSNHGKLARIKLCVNIAAAIARIHETNKYILVDLKPQNILVTIDGKVSIIDLDSCQINEGNKLLYTAPVSTPEYTPQESRDVDFGNDIINKSWDVFSYAIMTYEILCGIHPFVGTAQSPYENLSTIQEKIKHGISHVLIGTANFQVLPPPHKYFYELTDDIKRLFSQSFKESQNRPTIENFGKTFFEFINQKQKNNDVRDNITKTRISYNKVNTTKSNISLQQQEPKHKVNWNEEKNKELLDSIKTQYNPKKEKYKDSKSKINWESKENKNLIDSIKRKYNNPPESHQNNENKIDWESDENKKLLDDIKNRYK